MVAQRHRPADRGHGPGDRGDVRGEHDGQAGRDRGRSPEACDLRPRSAGRRFRLLPSLDLLGGRVVRLRGGDPDTATVYATDPEAAAAGWSSEGADVLHVVDLDAALGLGSNDTDVHRVVVAARQRRTCCEVAGGVRDEAMVRAWLGRGAFRVVLGTGLLADPLLAPRLIAAHGPESIVAAIDVRDGVAMGDGWRPGAAGVPALEAIARLSEAGIATFEVTAIARDGTMDGPDLRLLTALRDAAPRATLIASGGIRGVADLLAVRDAGCGGAILGRALYEGAITLRDARAALDA